MKRENKLAEGGSENLGLKKVKLYEGIDENDSKVERKGKGEDEENGSEQVDKNENLLGNSVLDNLDDLEELKNFDDDMRSDLIFWDSNEQDGLVFDLNIPVGAMLDDGLSNDYFGHTQKPMIKEKEPEVISISSHDSDDEVEFIGYGPYGYSYSDKGKEVATEIPYDQMEDLSLGLGTSNMGYAVGESSLWIGGERKYTKEEKGKATVDDQWLSLGMNISNELDLHIDNDDSFRTTEPTENAGLRMLTAVCEIAERTLRKEEEASRNRARHYQGVCKETAKRLARADHSNVNSEKGSSSKQQVPPSSSPTEQLGKSPGPFSDALKMVRQRISKRAAETLINWKPSESNQNKIISQPFVPSLLDLSLKALAENAEGLVSLELVPENLCRRLIHMLCDMRKMNAHILNIFVKGCPTEIRIKDCSWLTEEQLRQTFENCRTKDLRVLQLDLCGQCMLDLALKDALAKSSKSFSSLCIVSLRGACRLSDTGLRNLAMSAPLLQSLNLGQCTLLTSDSIEYIADCLGSKLKELYIDDCQKIYPMLMLPAFKKFKCLEVISVAGIHAITDQFVSEMVTLCGRSIKEIDLANCLKLTDSSLKTIGSNCANLCSLNISNLHDLTDMGIEYLANGCKSIQKLKLCHNAFSDEAMAAFLESSGESLMELALNNVTKVGPNTAFSVAKCSRKLMSLDISWCRRITDEALGLIVDSCQSLKLLKLFGCRQITNVFLKGHSNPVVRIIGLNMSPILDHMNLFEPEEILLRYSALQA